ncbi:MAG TPA: 16S rRNA (adenine(1518)-N(6)/adenine(1519)-N(6))-dimethyltransferase RsmA [Treponemataceae bacterium]|nr:16S rRNA (adenine(1518)-N(6)/adenine(1519)-N(6))-dimethyltransferase RsmA [Treponemataceae bacterium]
MAQILDYNSPAALKAFLDKREMSMQKKFGQNFLINESARKKLANATNIEKNTKIWEVGPGLGALTYELVNKGGIVTAFEIDRGFIRALTDIFTDQIIAEKLSLISGDFLKTWKNEAKKHGIPDVFFGNLPYNIAATIIGNTINEGVRFEKLIVTVQKEVALRMQAKPGTKDYSSFSILCQWAYEINSLMDLAGGSFWPRPNVDSRAIVMTKRKNFPACTHPNHFMALQKSLFVSRRKTIKNNLARFYSNTDLATKVLEKAKIQPSVRAETLSVPTLLTLSDISTDVQNLDAEKNTNTQELVHEKNC